MLFVIKSVIKVFELSSLLTELKVSTQLRVNSDCNYVLLLSLSVTSTQCCDRLQQEKEEVRVSLEKTLKSVEEQHKEELVQLEDRCTFTSAYNITSSALSLT